MSPVPTPLNLYRIARSGYESLFPPAGLRGRFDDPSGEYRVLYTSLDRPAAFAESLQPFRPDLATRAALAALRFDQVTVPPANLRTWASKRTVLQLRVPRNAEFLDLRRSESIEAVANEIAGPLGELGLTDLDESHILGIDRGVTQLISGWARQVGYDGILSASRFAAEWTNCAIFNTVRLRVVSRLPIDSSDPDLQSVARTFNIRVTG